jgi:hypothetical protein
MTRSSRSHSQVASDSAFKINSQFIGKSHSDTFSVSIEASYHIPVIAPSPLPKPFTTSRLIIINAV